MQEKYITDARNNRENLLTEKKNLLATNEEDIISKKAEELKVKESDRLKLILLKSIFSIIDFMGAIPVPVAKKIIFFEFSYLSRN